MEEVVVKCIFRLKIPQPCTPEAVLKVLTDCLVNLNGLSEKESFEVIEIDLSEELKWVKKQKHNHNLLANPEWLSKTGL